MTASASTATGSTATGSTATASTATASTTAAPPQQAGIAHLLALRDALIDPRVAGAMVDTAARWGRELARTLVGGARLLAAGNGGSAAQAQHLTAELVGRYRDERDPLSAICLSAETSTLTALANDYGGREMFARQVRAHGRTGDLCALFSTSGRSENVVRAALAARQGGLRVLSFTGPAPNPLAEASDEALIIPAATTATVQELHLVALHMVCEQMDAALIGGSR